MTFDYLVLHNHKAVPSLGVVLIAIVQTIIFSHQYQMNEDHLITDLFDQILRTYVQGDVL